MSKQLNHNQTMIERAFYLAFFLLMPKTAMAEPWDFAGAVAAFFISDIALGISVLVIVCCGIAYWFDKLSKEIAIRIAIGGILIFGAPPIANKLIELITS